MIGAESAGFAKTLVGTPFYLSPELCRGKPYNHKSDAWALGCVLYECMEARHPFTANSREGLFAKIAAGKYPAPSGPHGLGMRKIVTRLLSTSAERRFGADDVLRADEAVAAAKTVGVELEGRGRRTTTAARGREGGREVGGGSEAADAPTESRARRNTRPKKSPGFARPSPLALARRARHPRSSTAESFEKPTRIVRTTRPVPGSTRSAPASPLTAGGRRPARWPRASGGGDGERPEELRRAFLAARWGRAERRRGRGKGAELEPTEPTEPIEPQGFPPSKPPPSSNPSPPPRLVSASAARRSERSRRRRTAEGAEGADAARGASGGGGARGPRRRQARSGARGERARARAGSVFGGVSVDSPPASVDVRSKRFEVLSVLRRRRRRPRVPSRLSTAAGRVAALRAAGRAPSAGDVTDRHARRRERAPGAREARPRPPRPSFRLRRGRGGE